MSTLELRKYRIHLVTAVASILLYFFPIHAAIYRASVTSADYAGYNPFVEHMLAAGELTRPNFLYPLILALLKGGLGIDHFGILHLTVSLCFVGILAIILVSVIASPITQSSKSVGLLVGSTTLSLMVIGPILLFSVDQHEYLGYVMPTVYHNANMYLCKPFALASFYLLARLFDRGRLSPRAGAGMATLLILSALSKPNFVLALLPAVALMVAWKIYRRRPVDLKQVFMLVIVPIVLILAWQYFFTYNSPGEDVKASRLAFGWFVLWRDLHFVPKLFLSAAFPLSLAFAFRDARAPDTLWQFAWILFICALAINYLLIEVGRESHLNFAWTGQIAIFILFVASVRHFMTLVLTRPSVAREFRFYAVLTIFLLHVAGGITWYIHESTQSGLYW